MLNAGGDEQINLDAYDDSDWLHRNETFQANNIVTRYMIVRLAKYEKNSTFQIVKRRYALFQVVCMKLLITYLSIL